MHSCLRLLVAGVCSMAFGCASLAGGPYGWGWMMRIHNVTPSDRLLAKHSPIGPEVVEVFWFSTPDYALDVIVNFSYTENRHRPGQPILHAPAEEHIRKAAGQSGAKVVLIQREEEWVDHDFDLGDSRYRGVSGIFAVRR